MNVILGNDWNFNPGFNEKYKFLNFRVKLCEQMNQPFVQTERYVPKIVYAGKIYSINLMAQ